MIAMGRSRTSSGRIDLMVWQPGSCLLCQRWCLWVPGIYLIDLANRLLPEIGLKYETDYLFLEEQMVMGVGGRTSELLNQEIPGCDVPWLGSRISRDGNYVWATLILCLSKLRKPSVNVVTAAENSSCTSVPLNHFTGGRNNAGVANKQIYKKFSRIKIDTVALTDRHCN